MSFTLSRTHALSRAPEFGCVHPQVLLRKHERAGQLMLVRGAPLWAQVWARAVAHLSSVDWLRSLQTQAEEA
eukprot:9366-Alexandrium_andersonii.AAC.1